MSLLTLPRHIIETLYTAKVGSADCVCPICTSAIDSLETCTITKCGHYYHNDCIGKWIHHHTTCPTCRSTITESGLSDVDDSEDEVDDDSDDGADMRADAPVFRPRAGAGPPAIRRKTGYNIYIRDMFIAERARSGNAPRESMVNMGLFSRQWKDLSGPEREPYHAKAALYNEEHSL